LDEDCSKKDSVADNVSVSPTHEHIGASFIFIVQVTKDTKKYTTNMIIQQVYKGSHEEQPRRKAYRKGMKVDPYPPIKLKSPNCLR